MLRNTHRCLCAGVSAAIALTVLGAGTGWSQDVKVFVPQESTSKGLSTSPTMVGVQLQKSLELARRAQTIASVAQSTEELKEAAGLIMKAYFLQRAAHGGISKQQRANTKNPSIDVQDRTIFASRNNLIAAQNEFKNTTMRTVKRIEHGLEYLRAAIKQTETVLSMRHGG